MFWKKVTVFYMKQGLCSTKASWQSSKQTDSFLKWATCPLMGTTIYQNFGGCAPNQQLCSALIWCDLGTALLKGATLGCKSCCISVTQSQALCCLQWRHPKPRTCALTCKPAAGNTPPAWSRSLQGAGGAPACITVQEPHLSKWAFMLGSLPHHLKLYYLNKQFNYEYFI